MTTFPLPADAEYRYASRFDPGPSGHHGTDVFAPKGTPLLAIEDGKARVAEEPKGGLVVYLDGRSGARYYYAHLDEVNAELDRGARLTAVDEGDELGTVGNSGNAEGGPPHLHLQIKPDGETLADPAPLLHSIDPKRQTSVPPPSRGGAPAFDVPPAALMLLALYFFSRRGR